MAVPYGTRFEVDFDLVFPQGAYIVGEVVPSPSTSLRRTRLVIGRCGRASMRRPGSRIFKVTLADPSAEKDRDKSITVEIAAKVQPVPPAAVGTLPFRPVVLEGLTVQPRAETSGQAKWITWVIRATGLRAVDATPAKSAAA